MGKQVPLQLSIYVVPAIKTQNKTNLILKILLFPYVA